MEPPTVYLQRDQPAGVPPLALTGERTLPDVPEENYWFRRHLVVYEWIAARAHGRRVVDLACGEGYGSSVLGRTAASVVGVDANPEAFEHARLKYTSANVSFERTMIELWQRRRRLRRVPADDRARPGRGRGARADPRADRARRAWPTSRRPTCSRSRPRVPSARATRGTCTSTGREEFRALCERHFGGVDLLGLFHARKLRAHQWAIEHAGWDAIHARLRLHRRPSTTASRPRSRCATSRCGAGRLDRALDLVAVLRP